MPNSRRHILIALLGAVLSPVAVRRLPRRDRVPGAGRASAVPDGLADFFGAPASAAVLGRAYLKTVPNHRDANYLAALLDELPEAAHGPAARGDLRRALARCRVADFAAGRTVAVDGWILARSEARLCAAVALAA